jgi:N utilization substance protein A
MNLAIVEAIKQFERGKKIEKKVLIEALEAAMASASRKSYGNAQNIACQLDEETGEFTAYLVKKVVAEVTDPSKEITLEEAQQTFPESKLEDEVRFPLPPVDFGRIAAQTAKQVVLQRVREAEREAVYSAFKTRQGDLLSAVVLRTEGKNVIVDVGEAEGILPPKEQVFREDYSPSDRIKVLLLDVRRTSKGPQIVVSRTHPFLVKKLFELEVPEISEGIVEIKAVAREAGTRTKIAVQSHDAKVDPVGACVGMKGSRVQAIVTEILGEKIDIIPWHEEAEKLISSSLSPAKISRVLLDEESHAATVVVPEDQLSLAIGKKGQNVRLAGKLTGWKVDIKSEAQLAEEQFKTAGEELQAAGQALAAEEAASVEALPGVGPKVAEKLKEAGFDNVHKLAEATLEQLTAVEGIGEKTAQKILEAVGAKSATEGSDPSDASDKSDTEEKAGE